MATENLSAGGGASSDSGAQTGIVAADCKPPAALPALPLRSASTTVGELIDLYMAHYSGRDRSRVQRLDWWRARLDAVPLPELSDDEVHAAIDALAEQPSRYYAGHPSAEIAHQTCRIAGSLRQGFNRW